MASRTRRFAAVAGAALVALALTTACTPEPAPTPTPTGFASEEEAFAAAEATYRAYVDAVNHRRADPDSTPDPTDFLTGDAFNEELETDRLLAEKGLRISGDTVVRSISRVTTDSTQVLVTVCLDATSTRVLDPNDNDVTPADRETVQALDVTFILMEETAIISKSGTGSEPC